MAFAEKLIAVRRAHHLTQEQLAAKLFVTRQAVSRWERSEVTPGIDMMKLIAAVTGEPLSHLLEMPEHYCQSCGMILTPDDCGTDAAGTATDHYCKWCYDHGKYTYDTTMEAMIEDCAPRLAQNTGMSLDEAVSLMGAVLPQLERWRTVQENEERYGAEARSRYGNEAIDAANEALLDMDPHTWNDMKELERAILGQLSIAMSDGEPEGSEARKLVAMHRRWIGLNWGHEPQDEAYLGLAHGYLADQRFIDYYDKPCGTGATAFLVQAIESSSAHAWTTAALGISIETSTDWRPMATDHELVLYVMTGCPYCIKVKRFLADNGVTIPERNISTDPDAEQTLIAVGGKRQVPCLFIDGKPLYESSDIIAWVQEHLL